MKVFHGTSNNNAAALITSGIDVSQGGGELGRGFYTGLRYYEASRWAIHKHRRACAIVLELTVEENDFLSLDVLPLSQPEALAHRNNIRAAGKTRTHIFGNDVVWSPIVGDGKDRGDQHKWESGDAQEWRQAR